MIIEIGHFALILALGVAVQMALPLGGARTRCSADGGCRAGCARPAQPHHALLPRAHPRHVTSDFSVETVWANLALGCR
jgi:hypothetical protein